MFRFFERPFPFVGFTRRSLLGNLGVGTFIALFLIIFQPFEINLWITSHKILKLAGYGIIAFICPTIHGLTLHLLFKSKRQDDNWTVGKEILSIVLILALIALGNMIYSHFLHIMHFSLRGYINALIITVLIGFFPVSLHVLRKHNQLLKLNYQNAGEVNAILHPPLEQTSDNKVKQEIVQPESASISYSKNIELVAENNKDRLVLPMNDILYLESADNYSMVYYLKNEKVTKELIRGSLKRMEEQLSSSDIVRCHRAFMVNLNSVDRVEGNAAGYRLILKKDNLPNIPVSRNYGPEVISKLKHLV